MGRGFAFVAGIGGDDHLRDRFRFEALHEFPNPDVVGADPVEGRQDPLQHVIAPFEGARLFKGQEIRRAFHDAELTRLPSGIGADEAQFAVREMEAARTGAHPLPQFVNALSQLLHLFPRTLQEEHGDAGGALLAQAGKLAQPANEVLQDGRIGVHGSSRPVTSYELWVAGYPRSA